LLDALDASVAATLEVPAKTFLRDPASGVLHAPEVAQFAARLADAVGEQLDTGRTPLVLGGDCSILLGNALALRRRGRFGLLLLDGHTPTSTSPPRSRQERPRRWISHSSPVTGPPCFPAGVAP